VIVDGILYLIVVTVDKIIVVEKKSPAWVETIPGEPLNSFASFIRTRLRPALWLRRQVNVAQLMSSAKPQHWSFATL